MPKRRSGRDNGGESRVLFRFPGLHKDVVKAVSGEMASPRFHGRGSNQTPNREYSTHVMGRFECKNSACSSGGWASKKIAIVIKGFPDNGYNAEVYNQRCKFCDKLGTLILDKESYVERVAYRIKRWAGVEVEHPHYGPKKGLPHESAHCEGCKRGVCRETSG
ncbi:hypothetical protein PV08_09329 [Exophiala spinifera]|uniref:3CxxC-type domain-containing protein n=1 Tax=Exophiala spinifera TaxID=91928 RepID=A0A0D2B052_9EURO|nr:uncharacterized protein PV08_09329 [Exophiala spinifera]KIW12055.1 hypothetical protein PV08_09329 [Exophiala spinifera]